jgi:GNAT superfamily N-acetyltransferase
VGVVARQEEEKKMDSRQTLTPALSQRERETDDTWQRDDYTISADRSRLDLDLIHNYLCNESYWATGRSREVVICSIKNSLPFGIYHGSDQVGFARIVTDYATFAWVADVFVLPEHRGRGLSKWLMEVIIAHRQLQGFRRWVLSTRDAHGLYERFGFIPLHRPERWMERPDPNMMESPDYWVSKDSV